MLASVVWVALAVMVCGGVYYIMNRPSGTTTPVAKAPVETPKPVESALPPVPEPKAAEPIAGLRVVLLASEDAWVSVSADGKSAFVGVLKPNERREIAANEKIKVVAGNAGGLEISLNGKALDPIGPKGQVRTVELTQSGAQVIPKIPAPLL
jgi:hypothetical protein